MTGGGGFCTACGRPLDEAGTCPEHGVVGGGVGVDVRMPPWWVRALLGVVVVVVLVGGLIVLRADQRDSNRKLRASLSALDRRLKAETAASNGLSARLGALEARLNSQPDPAAVARQVAASVFTVEVSGALGSSFVMSSADGSSSLVTNYHVVEGAWTAGRKQVKLRQEGRELDGTIDRVSKGDDLAVVKVAAPLPPLAKAVDAPGVGDPVLVVGAPLGLGGTVSNGIVSALRDGYIQFSAPIGPGNSGGPVVNLRGQVIGVARSKLVAEGAEGLSFAIPISIVCTSVSVC